MLSPGFRNRHAAAQPLFVLAKQAACLGVLSAGQLLPGSRTVTGLFQLEESD